MAQVLQGLGVLGVAGGLALIHPWIGLLALGLGAILIGISLELGARSAR